MKTLPAGDTCTPSCKAGFNPVDAVCGTDGTLTTAAACTQITCPASDAVSPSNVEDSVGAEDCVKTLNAGETCTPSCKAGFNPVDAVCGTDGTLTTAAACTQITCDELSPRECGGLRGRQPR